MAMSLAAQTQAFTNREWKPGTPGITINPAVHYDEAVGAFKVQKGNNDTTLVITDDQPGVGGNPFQLHGEVKYEGTNDKAYLEMFSRVGGAKLSSQTQGNQTVMTKLMGGWRDFVLQVTLTGSSVPANQIELNAVLPDGGTVWLRNLRLEPLTGKQSATLSIILGSAAFLLSIMLWFIWRAGKKQRAAELKASKK